MQRSSVDFPLPLGPTRPTISSSPTSMLADDTIMCSSMMTVTPAAVSLISSATAWRGPGGA